MIITNMPQKISPTPETPRTLRTYVLWCTTMSDFNMVLQRAVPQKPCTALFAGELFESAAVLVWKEMRMRASEMVN